MDLKDNFKKNLEKLKQGLEVSSNPSTLFEDLSYQYEKELENNVFLKFKNNLSQIKVDKDHLNLNIFESNPYLEQQHLPEQIVEEQLSDIEYEKPLEECREILIEKAIDSISKEELAKNKKEFQENYTNLFDQPNSKKVGEDIKSIQNKLKLLEDWVSKISLSGPGGGAGQVYEMDFPTRTVYSNTNILRTDYYIGVNANTKTYIYLPTIGENVYDGRKLVVKDESGHCSLTPIRIVGTIDEDPDGAEIRVNNAALQLIFNNNSWRII